MVFKRNIKKFQLEIQLFQLLEINGNINFH